MQISDYQKACIHREIENVYGQPVRYSRDCDVLSQDILHQTERQISGTTLKRFFGLASGHHDPSAFTLDTLAIYAGFSGWNEFIREKEPAESSSFSASHDSFTDELSYSYFMQLETLQLRYCVSFFYPRHGDKRFRAFVNSDKPYHAIITEKEYLPNNLVYQFIKHIMYSHDASLHNAKIALTNAEMQLQDTEKPGLNNSCISHLHLICEHLKKHITQKNTYFFVFIYNLPINPAHQFIDLMYSIMQEFSYFNKIKFVISCRPAFWQMFAERHHITYENDSKYWHYVRFAQSEKNSYNVPKIMQTELNSLLKSNSECGSLSRLKIYNPGMATFMRIPLFLNIYLNYQQKTNGFVNDIAFFYHLLRRALYNDREGQAKEHILQEIVRQTNLLKNKNEIPFTSMTSPGLLPHAYRALLRTYLISERIHIKPLNQFNKTLKIRYGVIAEFLTILYWLRQYGYSQQLILHLKKHYQGYYSLYTNLISWLIKMAVRERQFKFLQMLLKNLVKSYNPTATAYFINFHHYPWLSSFFTTLRTFSRDNQMLVELTQMQHICSLYFYGFFELDHPETSIYLVHHCSKSYQNTCTVHTALRLIHAVFHNNPDQARSHYSTLVGHPDYKKCPQSTFATRLYATLIKQEPVSAYQLPQTQKKNKNEGNMLLHRFFHFHSLLFDKKPEALATQARETAQIIRKSTTWNNSPLLEQLKMMQAYGRLLKGETEQAGRLLDETDTHRFPVSGKIYWSLWYHLIRGRFFLAMNEANQAHKDFLHAAEMAEALAFPLFRQKLQAILETYKTNGVPEFKGNSFFS